MKLREIANRALVGAGVGAVATIAYRSIQHASAARAIVRSTCWTWRHLPFAPEWVWPYYSMFLLVGLPWFLMPRWRDVRAFATCLLAAAAIGWLVFLVFPTACLRPDSAAQPFYYRLLVSLDQPDNCLPCLHSAFSILAAVVLAVGAPVLRTTVARVALFTWVALICISIVALRQHTDLDMFAGVFLGLAAGMAHRFLAGVPSRTREGFALRSEEDIKRAAQE